MSARLWVRLFVVMFIVLVVAVVVLLYRDHQRYTLESALVPIVKPDTPETKVHPKDPEGMEIPNTELSIYEHLDNKKTKLTKSGASGTMPAAPTEGVKEDAFEGTLPPEGEIPPETPAPEESSPDIPFMPASSLKGIMMDLGVFPTPEEASQTWARAKTALPPSFAAAQPMLVRDQGTFHLYIVDVPSLGQGGDVCTILTKIGLFCQVMGP
jgi:hypothetical protein